MGGEGSGRKVQYKDEYHRRERERIRRLREAKRYPLLKLMEKKERKKRE